MKYLLFPLLINTSVFAATDWYGQKQEDSGLVFGYGKAVTYQQAKSLAYIDLSTKVEVRVTKDDQSKKLVKDWPLSVTASSESKTKSDIVFRNNVTVASSEFVDGQYYLALQYDKTSFQQRLSHGLHLVTLAHDKSNLVCC